MSDEIYKILVKTIDGEETTLEKYKGRVLMIVNVASKCGLTPQYEALQRIYEKYKHRGFEILGFPANNFLQQEPGNEEQIKEFCSKTYGVQFPMFSKISVKEEDQHPLYKYLTEQRPVTDLPDTEFENKLASFGQKRERPNDILWNFEKFLINRKGEIIARFSPAITPDDTRITQKIEEALND
jgi:glutathione peroxidase